MATKIVARARLTCRFVKAYSHMDRWGDYLNFKALATRRVRPGVDYGDEGVFYTRVIGSKKIDRDLQISALDEYFSFDSCTHEHDCCGCQFTVAFARQIKPGVFAVIQHVQRNV